MINARLPLADGDITHADALQSLDDEHRAVVAGVVFLVLTCGIALAVGFALGAWLT